MSTRERTHQFLEIVFLCYFLQRIQKGPTMFWLGTLEVGGVKPKAPQPGSRVPSSTSSRPHPHRPHDTTDQWCEIVWWLGRFEDFVLLLLLLLLRRCPVSRVHGHVMFAAFCHTSNGILTIPGVHGEYMGSLC